MAGQTVPPRSVAEQVTALLDDSPEIDQLITELAATRWTGRPGYPVRTMLGAALAKSFYTLPTWTRTVALVNEHAALRHAVGCTDLDSVTAALHERIPELGTTVAIDASDLPAYANGQRYLYKGGPERKTYADPDATWVTMGHRSAVSTRGGWFVLWLQAPSGCLRRDRPAAGVAGGDGQGCRVHLRGPAA